MSFFLISGELGNTACRSGGMYLFESLLTEPYGMAIAMRACGIAMVEKATNFIALTLFLAPFGMPQASRLERPWSQLMSAFTPAACSAAMRPFHTVVMVTSRSVRSWIGTAPVSHHLTTSFLILL